MRRFRPLMVLVTVGTLLALATPVRTADYDFDEKVIEAAERAVAFLRATQTRTGMWEFQSGGAGGSIIQQQNVGATALVGLALLASGVPPSDSALTRAESVVRANLPNLTYTYSLALSAMFLEKMNKDRNGGAVTAIVGKLLKGYNTATGGWGYYSPIMGADYDNSNTQFALLALFVARQRNATLAPRTILSEEQRFRRSQRQDGAWTYGGGLFADKPTPAMTCVGLVAMALGFELNKKSSSKTAKFTSGDAGKTDSSKPTSSGNEGPDALKDRQVKAALQYIAGALRGGVDTKEHLTYFLWSMERVCLIYGLPKLEGLDWFRLGAETLLPLQNRDGSWSVDGRHGVNCDTAFALLFLRRANILDFSLNEAKFRGGGLSEANKATAKPASKPTVSVDADKPLTAADASKIVREMANADPAKFNELVDQLTAAKGGEATRALREAIDSASASRKPRLREALALRFKRLSAKSLRDYLQQEDKELRSAAARAIGEKGAKDMIPDLIPLLQTDAQTREAALTALKTLTGQDFGPGTDGWTRWWQKNADTILKSGSGSGNR